VRRAEQPKHKRPHDAQIRFDIAEHTAGQNVVFPPWGVHRRPPRAGKLRHYGPTGGIPCNESPLQQAPDRPYSASPTADDLHTVGLLPLEANGSSGGIDRTARPRVGPEEAVPEVHHVHLEAVRLQVEPETEGEIPRIIVAMTEP